MDNIELSNIRKKIDLIDIQIHDLLMQRTDIVQDIVKAKKSQNHQNPIIYQPAREAIILKSILSRHAGKMPHSVIISLWRTILTSFCNMQCDFSLVYCTEKDDLFLRDALRYYFGNTISFKKSHSEFIALDQILKNPNTIGVFSVNSLESKNEWWLNLSEKLIVSGRLPFIYNDPIVVLSNDYMIVSHSHPIETGQDKSLFKITSNPDVGRISIINCFSELQQQAHSISVHDSNDLSHRYHLIEVESFFSPTEVKQFCINLKNIAQGKIYSVDYLGSYPAPINLEDYKKL